ncbi:transmembrane protein 268 isoform X1 [Nerophis lumbriciformis]|uniref:transmembrane protein 268 isoform X1 n=2 Tax=Nerophis lumbriciformis TaxID=546530 RepID=UPI002ADFBE50|nr:transmembrane protein 268-like isoform X1 [Nerophis lumbriciformis]XP_061838613.1 transmembrane protein 268-like isoform X1 [Nerophis lumbriciformis]
MEDTNEDMKEDGEMAAVQSNDTPKWTNGQCVLAMPSYSLLNPSFDLASCSATLETNGFQIPVADMEAPLRTALDVPSVRRYMIFNSALFHFMVAPFLYLVLWCSVFSTLRLYMSLVDDWILCLCVSLISIFLTTAILYALNQSKKEINVNLDVRLIQVNERMVKHNLLVAVADWVHNCRGSMQLYFVYWDMARCLTTLTETLEEHASADVDSRNILKKMSYLVLVTEAGDPEEVADSDVEQASGEQRPLLRNEDTGCGSTSHQRKGARVTANYSLVPHAALPAQARAYQLLMTYSAAYVKLLVSERLSVPRHHRLRPRKNHCSTASFCLCQFIQTKILD